jgi:hypothetical protein
MPDFQITVWLITAKTFPGLLPWADPDAINDASQQRHASRDGYCGPSGLARSNRSGQRNQPTARLDADEMWA